MREKQANIMDATTEEYYRELDWWLRGFSYMNLARWKIVQNTFISMVIAVFAFYTGAEPTFTVGVLALVNGVSFMDLASLWGNRQPPVDESRSQDKATDDSKKQP